MQHLRQKQYKRERRERRVRSRIRGTSERPRLSVFRSGRHVYAQLIDDVQRTTLANADDLKIAVVQKGRAPKSGDSLLMRSSAVGKAIAKAAREHRIGRVVFDRGGYAYHGAIKALADGAREGGLQF